MLTLTTQSPEVVQRVAQAELEFATYQAREGVFSRPTTYSSTPRLWSLLNGGACMAATSPSFARLHHACSHSRALRPLRSATGASTAKSEIKSANKSRMQHRTADKLVYCHTSRSTCRISCNTRAGRQTLLTTSPTLSRMTRHLMSRRTSASQRRRWLSSCNRLLP